MSSDHKANVRIDSSTHVLGLDSLALFARIKGRLLVVDTRHLVRLALLLCKRFIHLYQEKQKMLGSRHRPE
jgi:hypothetical protein